jgi:hypothetical protein
MFLLFKEIAYFVGEVIKASIGTITHSDWDGVIGSSKNV